MDFELDGGLRQRPAEFHCDMTTDGGGWVLIVRGCGDGRPLTAFVIAS